MVLQTPPEEIKFVLGAAVEVQRYLAESGERYCLIGALPFEERCVEKASDWELAPGIVLHTCSAEDLIILKTFAGRPRDSIDVESVLVRQGHALDWRLILRELKPLLELRGTPENLEKLQQLRSKVDKGA